MSKFTYDLDKLPTKDELEEMGHEEVRGFLEYIRKLNHALGNGTLEAVKNTRKKCKDLIKFAGELDATLKK